MNFELRVERKKQNNMKNYFAKIGAALMAAVTMAIILGAPSARAQLGFDPYYGLRIYLLTTNVTCNTIGTQNYTNGSVDCGNLVGKMCILFEPTTNNGATTATATIQTSQDNATWTTATNYWLVQSPTNVAIPNFYNNGTLSLALTNNQFALLPGTVATANGGAAGYIGTVLTPFQESTTNAIIGLSQDQPVEVAFNRLDQQRYWRAYYSVTGGVGATNFTVSAQIIGVTGPIPTQ